MLGWAVFGEHVAWTTLAGAGVIVAACLFAARRRDVAAAAVQAAS
jgi:S-adenosylmethionine uptake transporter